MANLLFDNTSSEILDNVPIGIIRVDKKGIITFVNKFALLMLGYKKNEILRTHVKDLYVNTSEPFQIKKKLDGLGKDEAAEIETCIREKRKPGEDNGGEVPIHLTAVWLYDSKGNKNGSIGYFEKSQVATQKAMQVVTELLTIGDFASTLHSVAMQIIRLIRCNAVVLYAYNEDVSEFKYPPTMVGVMHEDKVYKKETIPSNSIVYAMLDRDVPYIVNDVSENENFKKTRFARDENIKSLIGIPLKTSGRRVGVMFVNFRLPHLFSENDLDIVKHFGNQASIAIYNAQLYQKTKRQAEVFKTLSESGAIVSGEINLSNTLTQFSKQAMQLLNTNNQDGCCGHIALVEHGVYRSVAASSDEAYQILKDKSYRVDLIEDSEQRIGVAGRAIVTGVTQNVGNVREDKDYIEVFKKINSQLSVPLISDNLIVGVITVERPEINKFSNEDVSNLELLAIQTVSAVRMAQLLEQFESVQEIAKDVAKVTTLGSRRNTLSSIVEGIRKAVRCDSVLLFVYDPERDKFEEYATYTSAEIKENMSLVADTNQDNIVYRMLLLNEPYVVENIENDEIFREEHWFISEQTKSVIAIPLIAQAKKVGVIFINFNTKQTLSKYLPASLLLYSDQAAVAILNSSTFEKVQKNAELLRSIHSSHWALTSDTELEKILFEITKQVAQVVGVGDTNKFFSHIDLIKGRFLEPVAASDPEAWRLLTQKRIRVDLENNEKPVDQKIGITGRAVALKETQNVGNVKLDLDYVPIIEAVNSQLSIPLQTEGEVIGVLSVEHYDANAFSSEDAAIYELLATQAATVFSTAKLLSEIRSVKETAQIVAKLTTLGNRQETLQSIVNGTRYAAASDAVVLFVFDEEHNRLDHPPTFDGVRYIDRASRFGSVDKNSIVYEMLKRTEPYIVNDTRTDELFRERRFALDEEIKSVVVIPLMTHNQKVGVMFVNYRSSQKFTEAKLGNLRLFANQAAVAIYNYRLTDNRQKLINQLMYVNESLQIAKAGKDINKVIEGQLFESLQITDYSGNRATFASLWFYEPKTKRAKLSSVYPLTVLPYLRCGPGDSIIVEESIRDIQGEIISDAINYRKTVIVSEVNQAKRYKPVHFDTHSIIAIPIGVENDQIEGVLLIEHKDPNSFGQQVQVSLEAIAYQLEMSLKTAGQSKELDKSKRLVKARTNLALLNIYSSGFFHSVIDKAATIKLVVNAIRAQLPKRSKVIDELLDRIDIQTDAIFDLKRIFDPTYIINGGERQLVNETLRQRIIKNTDYNKTVNLVITENYLLDDKTGVLINFFLFRTVIDIILGNALEAMENVSRKILTVETGYNENRIQIEISDTGLGIPPSVLDVLFQEPIMKPVEEPGLGVGLMISGIIVEAYGGEVHAVKSDSTGTTIRILFPHEK